MAQPGAAAAALNSGEVALILAQLEGDVQSLCAAACVSRAWRAAAADAALWTRLECLPRDVAHRLNAERLSWLVARAAGSLQQLDLSDAGSLTDADLEMALRQPHALTSFTADSECERLTAAGVVAALASRRGLMVELRVAGLAVGPEAPESEDERDNDEHQRANNAFVDCADCDKPYCGAYCIDGRKCDACVAGARRRRRRACVRRLAGDVSTRPLITSRSRASRMDATQPA